MLITSKGDGVHYYGYDEQGKIREVVKSRGRFYKCKLVIGEGLVMLGEPLRNFTLVTD